MSETTCRHCGRPEGLHVGVTVNDGGWQVWCCWDSVHAPEFEPGPTYAALTARVVELEAAMREIVDAAYPKHIARAALAQAKTVEP